MPGRSETPLTRGPDRVIAYHGCSRQVGERVVAGEGFIPSANRYDWLGYGIYFWEHGPDRAFQWAELRGLDSPVVVEATITLGRCLDFLDTAHFAGMRQSYRATRMGLRAAGLPIPTNRYPYHNLDCLVVDGYTLDYSMKFGVDIQTVRGCFPEGKPIFAGSKILSQTHIQIAVRDPSCISSLNLL